MRVDGERGQFGRSRERNGQLALEGRGGWGTVEGEDRQARVRKWLLGVFWGGRDGKRGGIK